MYFPTSFPYCCFLSVNVFSLYLSHSDQIKRLPLYFTEIRSTTKFTIRSLKAMLGINKRRKSTLGIKLIAPLCKTVQSKKLFK